VTESDVVCCSALVLVRCRSVRTDITSEDKFVSKFQIYTYLEILQKN